MPRRLHIPQLHTGIVHLDQRQAHHARDVLRLPVGGQVELFDDSGHTALATIASLEGLMELRVDEIHAPPEHIIRWSIASAVPKGNRADWMIEKLSELGTHRFIPLAAQRSVVLPEGQGKRGRWERIAEESAKQCRRSGIMQIQTLISLKDLLKQPAEPAWFLSTSAEAISATAAIAELPQGPAEILLLIGPEGGWTGEEEQMMRSQGLTPVSLGATILRVETAAVAAAAIVAALAAPRVA